MLPSATEGQMSAEWQFPSTDRVSTAKRSALPTDAKGFKRNTRGSRRSGDTEPDLAYRQGDTPKKRTPRGFKVVGDDLRNLKARVDALAAVEPERTRSPDNQPDVAHIPNEQHPRKVYPRKVLLQRMWRLAIKHIPGHRLHSDITMKGATGLKRSTSLPRLSALTELPPKSSSEDVNGSNFRRSGNSVRLSRSASAPPRQCYQDDQSRRSPDAAATSMASNCSGLEEARSLSSGSENQITSATIELLHNPNNSTEASQLLCDLAESTYGVPHTFTISGTIPKVIALLDSPDSLVCQGALRVLEALTRHDQTRGILGNETIPKVITLLCGSRDSVCASIMSLVNALAQHAATRQMLCDCGLPTFVVFLDHPRSDLSWTARSFLKVLAQYVDTRHLLGNLVIPKLISSLGRSGISAHRMTATMSVVEDLGRYTDTRFLLSIRAIPKLISLLGHANRVVCWTAARVLEVYMQYADIRHFMMVTHDTIPGLISLLDCSRNDVHWRVVTILEALATHDDTRQVLGKSAIPKVISLLDHSQSSIRCTAADVLRILAQYEDVRYTLGNTAIPTLMLLLDDSKGSLNWTSMSVLTSLAQYDDTRSMLLVEVIPKLISLLDQPSDDGCCVIISVLEDLLQYDDIRAVFSSTHIVSKIIPLLEEPKSTDAIQLVANFLSKLAEYDDMQLDFKYDVILQMVALLGHAGNAIYRHAAQILSDFVDETTVLTDEVIHEMVDHLNHPDEDISDTSTILLADLAQYDSIQTSLLFSGAIAKIIGFMKSDRAHVQCGAITIMASCMDEEVIRDALLDTEIFSIISRLLTKELVSTGSLEKLLWCIGEFVQYDDFRTSILRTDTVYTLAKLQSTHNLGDDAMNLLSQLVADDHLSMSYPRVSPASPFISFQCLIGAQEALDKVLLEANATRTLLASYQISPHDYFLQVGFNEELLANGTGHLEEVYVYLAKEVQVQDLTSMIDRLGMLFRPFPCILLTAGDTIRAPTDSELPLGFDDVILERSNRENLHQILKLTKHLKEQGLPEAMCDEEAASGGANDNSSSHNDTSEANHSGNEGGGKQNTPPNNGGSGGKDEGGSAQMPDGDDNPDDPHQEGPGSKEKGKEVQGDNGIPEAVCNSHIEVYLPLLNASVPSGSATLGKLFQEFDMRVVIALEVQESLGPDPPSVCLQFNHLGFYTDPLTLEHPYEHRKIQVKIDSSDKRVIPRNWHPRSTPAAGSTTTHKDGKEIMGGLNVTLGKSGLSGGATISRKEIHAKESTRNLSRIKAHPGDTFVRWSYDVDDAYQRQAGLELEQGNHPFLQFWLRKEQMDKPLQVELSGYWVTQFSPKKRLKLFSAFKKRQPVPLLRNFCHLTCITIPSKLTQSGVSTLRLKACMPCSLEGSAILGDLESDFELGVEMDGQMRLDDLIHGI